MPVRTLARMVLAHRRPTPVPPRPGRPAAAWSSLASRALAIAVALGMILPWSAPTPAAAAAPSRPPVSRPTKIAPVRVVPYHPGRAFTTDTDLVSDSGYGAWMINMYLAQATPLPPIGAAFVKAERETGVNALYLVAHAMLETGFGTSAIAQVKRNLFGYHAYDRNPFKYATTFATYDESVLTVARKIRDDYLTPGGRFWGGFPTLRGMNLCYASDPRWADKIARIAQDIDRRLASLAERGIRFQGVTPARPPVAGSVGSIQVRWSGRPGAVIPAAIGFAVRWTPLAVAESGIRTPRLRAPAWTTVTRTGSGSGALSLRARTPSAPGLWRLDVRALDAGGAPLPDLDNPRIPSAVIRVVGRTEATLGVALSADGRLIASVRADGTRPIASSGPGPAAVPTTLETWLLPLDPGQPATRVGAARVGRTLRPGAHLAVPVVLRPKQLSSPALVVVRLVGDPATIGRAVPVVALLQPSAKPGAQGRAGVSLRTIWVRDPRSTAAIASAMHEKASPATPAPLAIVGSSNPGEVAVRLDAAVVAAATDYLPTVTGVQDPVAPGDGPGASPTPSLPPATGAPDAAPDATPVAPGASPMPEPVPTPAPTAATPGPTGFMTSADDHKPAGANTGARGVSPSSTPTVPTRPAPSTKPTTSTKASSKGHASKIPAAQPPRRSGASGIARPAIGRPGRTTTATVGATAVPGIDVAAVGTSTSRISTPGAAPGAGSPVRAAILVRTLAVGPTADLSTSAAILSPSPDLLEAAAVTNRVLLMRADGGGGGIRLVMAILVEPGSGPDAATLVVAWLPVVSTPMPPDRLAR